MAKVTGPLMSMDARGGFAGAIVFSAWKGRNTVRQLVTPANPKSQAQEDARNAIRVLGAGQRWANLTAEILNGETLTDKARLQAVAPSGQAWNGYLVKSAIGAGQVNYDAAAAAWAAIGAVPQGNWSTAAAALVPAIPEVALIDAGGIPAGNMTAGQVFFHYAYGLYMAGINPDVPGAVPLNYA